MSEKWLVEVIGGGLIGTSIALKIANLGGKVRIKDSNPAHQRVANGLVGEALLASDVPVSLVVVAVPVNISPLVIGDALIDNPRAIVIDTGSIKTKVLLEVEPFLAAHSARSALSRFLPTHPMAGREIAGPEGARSDLFEGRAWAITPHPELDTATLAIGQLLVRELGATSYLISPEEHDRQVAMTSHLPQLLASALAGVLEEPLDLAGSGLRDMTRLASSDPTMWQPIFEANQSELLSLLTKINESINKLVNQNFNQDAVLSFMTQGAKGAARVPGKHGGVPRNYGTLSVVIPDAPGALARLFNHCADAKINIEDLRIEHSPGQETGLISLSVKPSDLSTLNDYLSTQGWHSTVIVKSN